MQVAHYGLLDTLPSEGDSLLEWGSPTDPPLPRAMQMGTWLVLPCTTLLWPPRGQPSAGSPPGSRQDVCARPVSSCLLFSQLPQWVPCH